MNVSLRTLSEAGMIEPSLIALDAAGILDLAGYDRSR